MPQRKKSDQYSENTSRQVLGNQMAVENLWAQKPLKWRELNWGWVVRPAESQPQMVPEELEFLMNWAQNQDWPSALRRKRNLLGNKALNSKIPPRRFSFPQPFSTQRLADSLLPEGNSPFLTWDELCMVSIVFNTTTLEGGEAEWAWGHLINIMNSRIARATKTLFKNKKQKPDKQKRIQMMG